MSRELDERMYTELALAKGALDTKDWLAARDLLDKTYDKVHHIFSKDMEDCPFFAPGCGSKGCPLYGCPHHAR